ARGRERQDGDSQEKSESETQATPHHGPIPIGESACESVASNHESFGPVAGACGGRAPVPGVLEAGVRRRVVARGSGAGPLAIVTRVRRRGRPPALPPPIRGCTARRGTPRVARARGPLLFGGRVARRLVR